MGRKATYGEVVSWLLDLQENVLELNAVFRDAYERKMMGRKEFLEHLETQEETMKEILTSVKRQVAEWAAATEVFTCQ